MAIDVPPVGRLDWGLLVNAILEQLDLGITNLNQRVTDTEGTVSEIAGLTGEDAAVAFLLDDTDSETRLATEAVAEAVQLAEDADDASALRVQQDARLAAEYGTYLIAAGAGIDPTGVADSTAAIQAKLDAVEALAKRGTVLLQAGTYKLTSDLTIAADSVALRGIGDSAFLDFTNGGLVIDGSAGLTTEVALADLSLRRTGTAGPALHMKGSGAGTGVAHLNAHNVRIRSSTGQGLLVQGSYIGTFTGCYFMGCAVGIETAEDTAGANIYGNNLSFFGGETQGCVVAHKLDGAVGVNFYGHAIEGNTTSGVEVLQSARAVGYYGCYFEGNAGWDVKLGTTGNCYNMVVDGCVFLDASSAKDHAIILVRGWAIGIRGNSFAGYAAEPVDVQEASALAVRGEERVNYTDSDGPIVALNGGGFAFSRAPLKGQAVLDPASIPANSTSFQTITVTGAAVGDDATAHPNSTPESGLVWNAVVTAANTVTVILRNTTGSAIDPAARTWRARVVR